MVAGAGDVADAFLTAAAIMRRKEHQKAMHRAQLVHESADSVA